MDAHVPPRLFSLAEANALVPLLHARFSEARALRDRLVEVQRRLEESGRGIEGPDVHVDPKAPAAVQEQQRRARTLVSELRAILADVTEMGVEVKAADGLVDFRSRLQGRVVYLCWKYGEESVAHFHELDRGFAGRQPLPTGAEFVGDLLH